MRTDKRIMLVAQKQADVDDPKAEDLYRIATVATILQLLKLPDGTVKVLVEASIAPASRNCTPASTTPRMPRCCGRGELRREGAGRARALVISQFEQYVKLNKKVPPEVLTALAASNRPGAWPTPCGAHVAEARREAESAGDPRRQEALEHMLVAIESEMDVLQIEKRIRAASRRRWRRASASTT